MTYWQTFWFWVLVISVHELGHWIGFRLFGYKPRLKWIGLGVAVYHKDGDKMKIWQSFILFFLGVLFGGIIVFFLDNTLLTWFLYYGLSTVDMAMIMMYFTQKDWKIKVEEMDI